MRDSVAEATAERRARAIGEFIEALRTDLGPAYGEDLRMSSLKVRFPTEEDPSTLLVVRASKAGSSVIGFVGAFSLADAVLALRARLLKGSMKWREDVPWEQR